MNVSDQQAELLNRVEKEGLGLSKLLISLATGSVVLSITLLQTIGPNPVRYAPLLFAAWISLVLSVIFGLVDRIIYIHGLSEHPLLVKTDDQAEREYQQHRWLRLAAASEKTSWLQVMCFGIGIIMFLNFAIISI